MLFFGPLKQLKLSIQVEEVQKSDHVGSRKLVSNQVDKALQVVKTRGQAHVLTTGYYVQTACYIHPNESLMFSN